MHLLVRVCREQRLVEHPQKYLRQALEAAPMQGVLSVEAPRNAQRRSRQVELAVRWLSLAIQAPRGKANPRSIPLQFVSMTETSPPPGETPIRWLLATTLPVEELSQAVTCVEYYLRRWVIERFHYTLKSGCLVEERRFETVDNVCRAVACFSIVAWRLLWLLTEARQRPEQPCTVVLSTPEWEALEAITEQRYRRTRQGTPPTLGEAVKLIAKLGGHLGRKCDGLPGVKTLWRGLARLSDIATGWLLPRPP